VSSGKCHRATLQLKDVNKKLKICESVRYHQ
jgi:hypothetical protein